MRTVRNSRFQIDFFDSAGWVTVVVTELKTGFKVQATAGDAARAQSAAMEKLRLKNQSLRALRQSLKKRPRPQG